ncbi:MAG: hypothetical protein Q7N50_04215 [Armatimonadota bacterium]|nr:hypothetical protein [Armatimonadota bacterium]
MLWSRTKRVETIPLENPASIVVIGGGPAGCFFAIEALRQAHQQGRELNISIIEQKSQSLSQGASQPMAFREGCNYCAGGISPRLVDVLDQAGIAIPPKVIQSRVQSVTIQGSWKHIELRVPAGRKMYSVYRGSKPCVRSRRNDNFDSYLLECALDRGARVITGQAYGVEYSPNGKPIINYRVIGDGESEDQSVEADFVVVAGGVNQTAGMSLENSQLIKSLRALIPQFRPPRVRKALICELKADKRVARSKKGEVYFVDYGSKDLIVEMSSLLPKEEGLITLVLLGKSVDRADDGDKIGLIDRFLGLPHLLRLLPRKLGLEVVCACFPNMTVGTAKSPFGHRIAVIGDMVVARLYKDGILSAHSTAKALACCLLENGVDPQSLKENYWPIVESLRLDNRFGKIVFFLNRVAFSHPMLSRSLYQAALTERKSRQEGDRYLEKLLWKIASGDDTYKNIFRSMVTVKTLKAIFVGGILITIRNYITELFFGLRWGDIGRFPTGVYSEVMEAKRREYADKIPMFEWNWSFDFERMYSIKIRGERDAIFTQLAKFGEQDMEYFRPRIVSISKMSGSGNEVGKHICYRTPFRSLTFSIVLEAVIEERYIVYRVCSGFAKGGALIFDVEDLGLGVFDLSIYVAFNFRRGRTAFQKAYRGIFKFLFPHFVHDVLWNYALCQLKDIAESEDAVSTSPAGGVRRTRKHR